MNQMPYFPFEKSSATVFEPSIDLFFFFNYTFVLQSKFHIQPCLFSLANFTANPVKFILSYKALHTILQKTIMAVRKNPEAVFLKKKSD